MSNSRQLFVYALCALFFLAGWATHHPPTEPATKTPPPTWGRVALLPEQQPIPTIARGEEGHSRYQWHRLEGPVLRSDTGAQWEIAEGLRIEFRHGNWTLYGVHYQDKTFIPFSPVEIQETEVYWIHYCKPGLADPSSVGFMILPTDGGGKVVEVVK